VGPRKGYPFSKSSAAPPGRTQSAQIRPKTNYRSKNLARSLNGGWWLAVRILETTKRGTGRETWGLPYTRAFTTVDLRQPHQQKRNLTDHG